MPVLPINMKKVLFVVCFLIVSLMFSVTVQAEQDSHKKTVEVIGTGKIIDKDVPSARSLAISNSLVSAITMVVTDLLSVESFVRNFQTLNEILYSRTDEFIQEYKVLTSSISGDIFRVMVQATVSVDKIEQQMSSARIMLGKQEMPRILLFITEQSLEDLLPEYRGREDSAFAKSFSVIAMAEAMQQKGFAVIDHGAIVQNQDMESTPDKTELENKEAVQLGVRLQADVVIVGKAAAYKTSNLMGENIRSFKGIIKARALRTDTGEEIAITTQAAITTNTDEIAGGRKALSAAGSLAGEKLASQIAAAWLKQNKPFDMVEIIVQGTGNLANFVKFRKVISDLSGVEGIRIKEMKSDEATMIVNFQGNAKELADALMLKNFESMGINIYEVSQNRLRIELIPG